MERSEIQDQEVQFADVLVHRQQLMGCDVGAVQHTHWHGVVDDALVRCRWANNELAARKLVEHEQAEHELAEHSFDGDLG